MSFYSLRKIIISLLLLNCFLSSPQANSEQKPSLKGAGLSLSTEELLTGSGFSVQRQELTPTGNDIFAFNLRNLIHSKSPADSSRHSPSETMLILLSQEDFTAHSQEISALMKKIQNSNLNFSVEFVFTALDARNDFFPGYEFFMQGTQNFAKTLDDGSSYFAVLANFSKNTRQKAEIFTTGGKSSTPLWLAKETVEAFQLADIPFCVPQKLLSIYRAGLLFGDGQMASFFKEGIPCIKIQFSQISQISALENLIFSHEAEQAKKSDVHYSFFTIGNKTFWINELMNIIAVDVFGIFVILFLVCFTFTGKNRIKSKRDFSKFWLIIPAMLFISVLSLYAGQLCCEKLNFIAKANPVIQFAAKLLISVMIISLFFLLQVRIKLPLTSFLYGFMVVLVSAASIFLFSLADITVFWVFVLEYFIVYFTRNFTRLFPLIISFLLMLIPFLSYIAVYFAGVNDADVKMLISATLSKNIMLSLILFPFQAVWLKVLFRLKALNKDKSLTLKKIAGFTFLSAGIITVFMLFFAFFTSKFVYSKKHDIPQFAITERPMEKDLFCEVFKDNSSTLQACTLKFRSKKQAVRCTVTVSGESGTPVLDSSYGYSVTDNSRTAVFHIPDFPPQEFEIEFSTEKSLDKTIAVTAFFETEKEGELKKETVILFAGGENTK